MEVNLKNLTRCTHEVLNKYHFEQTNRYRSICFMTSDIEMCERIKSILHIELSQYEFWLEPNQGVAPKYGVSRQAFQKQLLENTTRGLCVYRPEEWLSSWSTQEQAAFWSFISMLHGYRDIIFVTSINENSDIGHYMVKHDIGEGKITYWLSNKVNK